MFRQSNSVQNLSSVTLKRKELWREGEPGAYRVNNKNSVSEIHNCALRKGHCAN